MDNELLKRFSSEFKDGQRRFFKFKEFGQYEITVYDAEKQAQKILFSIEVHEFTSLGVGEEPPSPDGEYAFPPIPGVRYTVTTDPNWSTNALAGQLMLAAIYGEPVTLFKHPYGDGGHYRIPDLADKDLDALVDGLFGEHGNNDRLSGSDQQYVDGDELFAVSQVCELVDEDDRHMAVSKLRAAQQRGTEHEYIQKLSNGVPPDEVDIDELG